MRFASRVDAGRQLGQHLLKQGIEADIVLGLPRGGVVVAAEVARAAMSARRAHCPQNRASVAARICRRRAGRTRCRHFRQIVQMEKSAGARGTGWRDCGGTRTAAGISFAISCFCRAGAGRQGGFACGRRPGHGRNGRGRRAFRKTTKGSARHHYCASGFSACGRTIAARGGRC